jgi:WD40 repeat protein
VGTPQYMPPEQIDSHVPDERLDVYALGATLYHVISGKPPFEGPSVPAILDRVLNVGPAPLVEVEPKTPRALQAIVAKAMARDRAARYASAAELADDLRRYQTGQLVASYHYGWGERAARFLGRHRAVVGLSAAFLAVLASLGAVGVGRIVAARERAERQLADLLVERGERELLDGAPSRALVYFQEAMARGFDAPVIHALIAPAARPLDASLGSHAVDQWTGRFSPDGSRLVTFGAGPAPSLWDTDGNRRGSLDGPARGIEKVAFSPDGSQILVSGACSARDCDHSVQLWDAASGAYLFTLPYIGEHAAEVRAAGFAGDGRAYTFDGFDLVIWDLAGRASRTGLHLDHRDWTALGMPPLIVSRDGRRALVLADRAELWDLETGLRVGDLQLAGAVNRVVRAVLDDRGERVAVISASERGRIIAVLDGKNGEPVAQCGDDGRTEQVAFSPDGKLLVGWGGGSGGAVVWEAASGVRRTMLAHPTISGVRFSPDGRRVATFGADGTVRVWTTGGALVGTFDDLVDPVDDVAFAAGPERVLALAGGTQRAWKLPEVSGAALDGGAINMSFGARGQVLVSGRGLFVLWDPAARSTLGLEAYRAAGLAADPDHVLVVETDGTLARLTLATGALERVGTTTVAETDVLVGHFLVPTTGKLTILDGAAQPAGELHGHHFQVDGATGLVAYVGDDGRVAVWDLARGAPLAVDHPFDYFPALFIEDLLVSRRRDRVAGYTPDNQWQLVYTVGAARPVRIADPGARGAFSPDGARFITWGAHAGASIWDTADGRLLATLPGEIDAVAWSTDGVRVFTGDAGGALRAWDAANGRQLADLGNLGAALQVLAVDGDRLLASTFAQTVVLEIGADTRPAAAVARLAAASRFHLGEDNLVPRRPTAEYAARANAVDLADSHFEAAFASENGGDARAFEHFRAAYQLTAWPYYQFQAGLAASQIPDRELATRYLRAFLDQAPPGEQRTDAEERLAEVASGKVGTLDDMKRHFESGQAHFMRKEYRQAREEFMACYRLRPGPWFLFNVAVTYEKTEEYAEAARWFRRYLELAPAARDRDRVAARLTKDVQLAEAAGQK